MQRWLLALACAAACGGPDRGRDAGDAMEMPADDAAALDGGGVHTMIDAGMRAHCAPARGTRIAVEPVAAFTGAHDGTPVLVTSPPGDRRLFVVLQPGTIRIIDLEPELERGQVRPTPFANLSRFDGGTGAVLGGDRGGDDERGLLGLAFHPDYARNRRLYVFYTAPPTQAGMEVTDVIAELEARADDPDRAEPTGRILLALPDPRDSHNGGMMAFGRDGRLWVGLGDGGGVGDVDGNAQRDDTLHGKMIRIDVDAAQPTPLVWAKGLRNPWRWSFDAATGDMYIADVGQDGWEEVNVVPASATAAAVGPNFGWNAVEGRVPYPGGPPPPAGLTAPALVHAHDDGWRAIVGGQVYRGTCFPDLVGTYLYTDYGAREIWALRWRDGQILSHARAAVLDESPTSLHADATGELFSTLADGRIVRLVARP